MGLICPITTIPKRCGRASLTKRV